MKKKIKSLNLIFIKRIILLITFLLAPFEAKTNDFNQNLKWKRVDSEIFLKDVNDFNQSLKWKRVDSEIFLKDVNKLMNFKGSKELLNFSLTKFNPHVRAAGRGITIDNVLYPEISNYVPNAFVEDPNINFTLTSRFISRTRSFGCRGDLLNCADGILNLNYTFVNLDEISFGINYTVQSLTSRRGGTKIGEGGAMGFKLAKEITDNWSIALGGENIVHFDEHSDLGRNFYLVSSNYFPINDSNNAPLVFLNFGIGSDFFAYKGNGNLGTINCLGSNTLTIPNSNNCKLGIISSASILFNEHIGFVIEWFGYGLGAGFSTKPLKNYPLTFSIYATDFLGDFPKYINDGNTSKCSDDICETRFYGNISISF